MTIAASPSPFKLALVASLLLHALLVLARSLTPAPTSPPLRMLSSWATNTVEVGLAPAGAQTASPNENTRAATPMPEARADERAPMEAPTATRRTATPAVRSMKPAPRLAAPASSLAAPSSASPLASSSSGQASGALGMVGLPAGVQHFAKAFAWALPEGGHRDAAWSELPLGAVGKAIVQFRIGAEGRIEKVEFDPDVETPAPLRRMIDHAVFLLRPRKFSLDSRSMSEGSERISVEVSLSEQSVDAPEEANPRDLATEGHRPPEAERPGYARFTLNSGRHLEAVLRRLTPR